MLENDVNGRERQATAKGKPSDGLPTKVATGSLNMAMRHHRTTDMPKFVQKATLALACRSFFVSEAVLHQVLLEPGVREHVGKAHYHGDGRHHAKRLWRQQPR